MSKVSAQSSKPPVCKRGRSFHERHSQSLSPTTTMPSLYMLRRSLTSLVIFLCETASHHISRLMIRERMNRITRLMIRERINHITRLMIIGGSDTHTAPAHIAAVCRRDEYSCRRGATLLLAAYGLRRWCECISKCVDGIPERGRCLLPAVRRNLEEI